VLVAEYNSIRSSVDRKATAQLTILGLNVTGIATVVGFIISKNLDLRLLLVLPIFSSTLGLLTFWHDRTSRASLRYITEHLRPLFIEYVDDDRVMGWTERYANAKERPGLILSIAIPMGVLFPVVSLTSLILVIPKLDSEAYWVAWGIGLLLCGTLIGCWGTNIWVPFKRIFLTGN
jgi:hypothetical protein